MVLVAPLRMSRLTTRIMAIMVFPLSIFLVGLLSIDQYRTTLIQSEFIALERQGFTLARSLALAEADRDQQFARRRLSAETMTHLLPLVGLGSSLRARVFQPNGLLLADTARQSRLRISVEVKRRENRSWLGRTRDHMNNAMKRRLHFSVLLMICHSMLSGGAKGPIISQKFWRLCQANPVERCVKMQAVSLSCQSPFRSKIYGLCAGRCWYQLAAVKLSVSWQM